MLERLLGYPFNVNGKALEPVPLGLALGGS